VILIEAGPRLLPHLPARLSTAAQRQLERLGVEVRLNCRVEDIRAGRVDLADGQGSIEAGNLIWAAGVSASPLTRRLGVELDRAGRVKVAPDLSLPGRPEVFAIGDLALVPDRAGRPVPGVSPAAMQMARHVARLVDAELRTPQIPIASRPPFTYWDKGTMATIGRSAAVAKIGPLEFGGVLAWFAWLFIHLIFLIGFDNKAVVLWHWIYSYFTYKRGARIITSHTEGLAPPPPSARAPVA
jgi:NADH dehydrogenase